jgi:hypothetical protein
MTGDACDKLLIKANRPTFVTLEDKKAHESWLSKGTVDVSYVLAVLGDPAKTVIPNVAPTRILDKDQVRQMDCPFPPEPGYE